MRAYFNLWKGKKEKILRLFAKLKNREKILQEEFMRKSRETKPRTCCARAFFTHVRYARVRACAAVLREIERPGCMPGEPNRGEAAVARAANPIGRDNGNNAIGASARDIGARRPCRCA